MHAINIPKQYELLSRILVCNIDIVPDNEYSTLSEITQKFGARFLFRAQKLTQTSNSIEYILFMMKTSQRLKSNELISLSIN